MAASDTTSATVPGVFAEGITTSGVGAQAVRNVAVLASGGALLALVIGGTLMALTTSGPASGPTSAGSWMSSLAWLGPAALAAISMFDIFTVPALHQTLGRHGPAAIVVATGCAVLGDLLGVVGRLTQVSVLLSQQRGWPDAGSRLLDLLQETLNTAGFLLVAVSFTIFGVLFGRIGARVLGVVAVVAGVATAVGQVPPLQPVFYLANVAFLAWYVGLIRAFRRSGQRP